MEISELKSRSEGGFTSIQRPMDVSEIVASQSTSDNAFLQSKLKDAENKLADLTSERDDLLNVAKVLASRLSTKELAALAATNSIVSKYTKVLTN